MSGCLISLLIFHGQIPEIHSNFVGVAQIFVNRKSKEKNVFKIMIMLAA